MDSTKCNHFHPTLILPQTSNKFGAELLKVDVIKLLNNELVHPPPLWLITYPTMHRAVLLLLLLPPPPLLLLLFLLNAANAKLQTIEREKTE